MTRVRVVTLFAAVFLIGLAANSAGGHAVRPRPRLIAGVVPDVGTRAAAGRPLAHAAELPYGGGPVLHWNDTHVIFWQPAGSGLTFDPGYQSLIEQFLGAVAADSRRPTNVYGLSGQYRDSAGPAAYQSSYRGAVLVSDPLPPSGCVEPPPPPLGTGPGWRYCVTGDQLETEVQNVLNAQHLPQTLHDVYFLVTPAGLGSCQSSGPQECALGGDANRGYCGYHSTTVDDVPYAVIPYNAVPGHCRSDNPRPNSSTADPTLSVLSHEHNEAVTDPLGDAWIDGNDQENGDLCVTSFGAALGGSGAGAWNESIHRHHYYLQEEWSNATGSCQSRAPGDVVTFSAARRAQRDRKVTFTPRIAKSEAPIHTFAWFFGDHRQAMHRRAAHAFERSGSYRVVLRTTDAWGNWAFYARRIRIARS